MGFGRACAPLRCAHPSFWAHCQTGRCAPSPSYRSFSWGPNSAARGVISFHWAKLHVTELHCIILSYAAPSWAPVYPNELYCTLLRGAASLIYAAPYLSFAAPYLNYAALSGTLWAKLHPLSYTAPFWATLHPTWATLRPKSYAAPSELSCNLLSYAEPIWAMLHTSELRCTLLSYASP